MSAQNTAFQLRPEAVDAVRVVGPTDVFPGTMADDPVLEAPAAQAAVGKVLIGTDFASRLHLFDDYGLQGDSLHVRNDAGEDITAPFEGAKYDGFTGSTTATLPVRALAADVGFIDFHMAGKRIVSVNLGHVFTDLMPHAPSGLVGDAELPLEFLGGDTVPRGGEQVEGVEPKLKGGARTMEGSAGTRMDMMAAPGASIGRMLGHLMEFALLPALGADGLVAVSHPHEVGETGIVVGETFQEVLDGEFHGKPPLYL